MNRELFLVAGVLAVLVGCENLPSVGPDYETPAIALSNHAMPDAGLPTEKRTAIGEFERASEEADARLAISTNSVRCWWTRFDDDVLTNLIGRAVSDNLDFLMAQERLTQSRWALLGSYAAYLPKVSANGGLNRFEYRPYTRTGAGTTSRDTLYNASFDASWEIDLFGGSRRQTEAAWASMESAEWSVADAWVSLVAEVGSTYISLRTTQQRIEVARTNLVLQTETYDILKSRLDSGIGDQLAVNQSKYIVEQTHAAIPVMLAREEQLKNALAILTGRTPGDWEETLKECPRRDWMIAPGRLSEVPLDMLRARPDVRIAERNLAAATARIGVAKSLWYPKFYISGSLGSEALSSKNFFRADSFFGTLGPSISWPIFQGGRIYSNIKIEEAKVREAALAYERVIERAYGDVRDVYADYTQEYHRYEALKNAVKAAQDAVTISNDLYKNGLRDFTAVIDAQRSLMSLEEQLVVSRGQITQNVIRLYKALGGGVELR